MDVAIPLYDRFAALDAIGPYEVLSRLPEARIAGEDFAKAVQLLIEYDPEPPFDSGSADKAPPELVELIRQRAAELA